MVIIFKFSTANYNYKNQGNDWYLNYPKCNSSQQSPINFTHNFEVDCKNKGLSIEWENSITSQINKDSLTMQTEGKFGTMTLRNGDKIISLEGKYMEIHVPSNHRINNLLYDAEINFVFKLLKDEKNKEEITAYFSVLFNAESNDEN